MKKRGWARGRNHNLTEESMLEDSFASRHGTGNGEVFKFTADNEEFLAGILISFLHVASAHGRATCE